MIKIVVISFVMSLCGGCGSNFEWLPEASTTSNSSTTPVSTTPVASAGTAQSVIVGTLVTLDGSGSSAASGATITYSWSISKPSGSSATLSSATVVKPTFTADVAGSYVLSLVVTDGTTSSAAATVTVTASIGNAAPVANAGTLQNVVVGDTVRLDGSLSSDANKGDTLTYSWSFISAPAGSSFAQPSPNLTGVNPTFTTDVAGSYVLSLVVTDGTTSSAAATVTITASVGNAAPVANAGPPTSVITGATVTLDGSLSSDANKGDTLTYSWSFISAPYGSRFTLPNSSFLTGVNPTFTTDKAGDYVFKLVVNDGKVDSALATVLVTAIADTFAPVTTASPSLTAVSDIITVTLTANEPTTIYYTTNGVDPDPSTSPSGASPVLNIPISIIDTLKFFAIDIWGNKEATKTYTATGSLSVTW